MHNMDGLWYDYALHWGIPMDGRTNRFIEDLLWMVLYFRCSLFLFFDVSSSFSSLHFNLCCAHVCLSSFKQTSWLIPERSEPAWSGMDCDRIGAGWWLENGNAFVIGKWQARKGKFVLNHFTLANSTTTTNDDDDDDDAGNHHNQIKS